MQCFRCDQEAVQECPRCGALYCDDHGDALCARCADPVLAVPSYRVFRGSLLALLIGSLVAIWLLVLPPAGADQDRPPSSIVGIVPTAAAPKPSATASTGAAEGGSPTPGASPSASATSTPTPNATPTPTATATTYTIKRGDTLTDVANQFGVTVDAIQRANNIKDPTAIQVGDTITIPK